MVKFGVYPGSSNNKDTLEKLDRIAFKAAPKINKMKWLGIGQVGQMMMSCMCNQTVTSDIRE